MSKLECIKFEQEKKYIKDFLKLPRILYSGSTNMENASEVEQLLCDRHPLSKYFHLDKFLIYNNGKIAGRFVITSYEGDEKAYLGFFECVDDSEVARFLFDKAYAFAREKGFTQIVGPVDASFWIKYRLKINMFDKKPYTGEPYNREYYYKLFAENGFEVAEHYTSNGYRAVSYLDAKYAGRYKRFREQGYEIFSPGIEDFDKVIVELYGLITRLYSDFPIYKELSMEDFKEVFKDYKYIINMNMVRMAYYEGEAVGFFISVPDYGNNVYHLHKPWKLLKVLRLKKKPKGYVLLYMGALPEHRGLGAALAGSIIEELKDKKLPSIGALARDGKVTQGYGKGYLNDRYEYVLMSREIFSTIFAT